MSDPPKPTTPPLEALIQEARVSGRAEVPPDEFTFHLGGYYHLKPTLALPTWRHKVYWFLRKLIDWIHP